MKVLASLKLFCAIALLATVGRAASTGEAFYGDPPDATNPWAVHDPNRPQPPRVEPLPYDAEKAKPPAGAIVLFDGTEASIGNWEADTPTGAWKVEKGQTYKWILKDGAFQCVPKSGYVRTKAKIGDCQLHIEWAAPTPPQGESQGRGNSGIFFMGGVEIQVLDNYENPTYADGFACSMYAVSPALANALRPSGEFQSIDITFRRPIYKDGKCEDPGNVTVYCNGILVQDHRQIEGPTGHRARPQPRDFGDAAPLKLQDHGNPVRFRNIWYLPLGERTSADGVKNGPMTPAETTAKRVEIAAMIRADAAKMADQSLDQTLRLAESLVYEKDEATLKTVEQAVAKYTAIPADKIDSKKDDIIRLNRALAYLGKFKLIDGASPMCTSIDSIVKSHGWDKKGH